MSEDVLVSRIKALAAAVSAGTESQSRTLGLLISKATALSPDPGCAHFSKKPALARRACETLEGRQGGNTGVTGLGSWRNKSKAHNRKH